MSGWNVYLITRCTPLADACLAATCILGGCVAVLLFITLMIGSYGNLMTEGDKEIIRGCRTWIRRLGLAASLAFVGLILTPTSEQAAAIYVIPRIANSQEIKKEAGEIYDLAKDWLKKQTK